MKVAWMMMWIGFADGCGAREHPSSSSSSSPSPSSSSSPTPLVKGDYWQRLGDVDRRLPGPIFFAQGSEALDEGAMGVVEEAARVIAARAELSRIAVQGWADGAEGDDAAREALGERRAKAVRDALVARGIATERLVPSSGPTIVSPHAATDENSRAGRRKVTLGVIEPRP